MYFPFPSSGADSMGFTVVQLWNVCFVPPILPDTHSDSYWLGSVVKLLAIITSQELDCSSTKCKWSFQSIFWIAFPAKSLTSASFEPWLIWPSVWAQISSKNFLLLVWYYLISKRWCVFESRHWLVRSWLQLIWF